MATPYECYTELKAREIRILQLLPGRDTATVQATLKTISLNDSNHNFVALSYRWGKHPQPDEHKVIKINGEDFSVWPNLNEALFVLRKDVEIIHLGIDAICINQEDPKEKNNQIPLMDEIYTSASKVYVGLERTKNDNDYVMETMRRNKEDEYKSDKFALGLFQMLLRPWWTRTWIVQEYILNKSPPKIFCGQGTGISSDLLFDVWKRVGLTKEFTAKLFHRREDLQELESRYLLSSLRDNRHKSSTEYLKPDLRKALPWLKGFKATEPRDKIYGVLGLVKPERREQFVKEFGIHTERSASEVYHDATIYLLVYEKSSTFFYEFAVGRWSKSAVPSWVPNFNLETYSHVVSPVR